MKKIILIMCFIVVANANYYTQAGKKFNIDPQLLWTIAYKESSLNPNAISKRNKTALTI